MPHCGFLFVGFCLWVLVCGFLFVGFYLGGKDSPRDRSLCRFILQVHFAGSGVRFNQYIAPIPPILLGSCWDLIFLLCCIP
jgi:hypothetical protein